MIRDPWVVVPQPRPVASFRLFCFPYAGGSASMFCSWPRRLPSHIELCAVQLPGREERIAETPITDWHEATDRLVTALRPRMDRPFALLGHSLGALLAFEVAHCVAHGQSRLVSLFVSAHEAPHHRSDDPPTGTLPEDEFVQRLRRFDGTPEALLEDPDIRATYFPLLRADFSLADNYAYLHDAPLAVPISAYGGTQDEHVSPTKLDAWREHTTDRFRRVLFPGGHFFVNTSRAAVLSDVTRELLSVEL